MFRKLIFFVFAGALLGIVVASIIGPMYIAWDNTPAQGQALCNCADCVRSTAARLIKHQLMGAALGVVSLLAVGVVILRSLAKGRPAGGATTG